MCIRDRSDIKSLPVCIDCIRVSSSRAHADCSMRKRPPAFHFPDVYKRQVFTMISEKAKNQIQVVQGDITKLDCDGIVNAANRSLQMCIRDSY